MLAKVGRDVDGDVDDASLDVDIIDVAYLVHGETSPADWTVAVHFFERQ